MPQTKEQKAIIRKIYLEKNKEKIAKKSKEWYEKTKEKRLLAVRKYKENNKEKIKAYNDSHTEERKEYRNKHKERQKIYMKEYTKEYRQRPEVRKKTRMRDWKCSGVICENMDLLYEKYINTTNCELCEVILTEDKTTTRTTRCLDHDHDTGLFRNVVCWNCNLNILPNQTIIGEI